MEQKAKFIIVGLIGVVLVSVFLLLQSLSSKQQVIKERDGLRSENASLASRAEKLASGLRDAENKMASLREELGALTAERDQLQQAYDAANRAKDELLERLQAQQQESQAGSAIENPTRPQERGDEYWGQILQQKTELQMQLDDMRKELKTTQVKNEELNREKTALELEVGSLKRQAEELQHQIDYNKKVMDNIAQELVWEKNERIKIEEGVKPFKKENAMLARQLKGLSRQKMDLEKKLQRLEDQKSGLGAKVREMETALVDKISRIDSLKVELEGIQQQAQSGTAQGAPPEKKESVELPPIVVRPQEEPETIAPQPPQAAKPAAQDAAAQGARPKGNILTINKDSNFVIIDIGEEAKVRVGDTFQVERGGAPVAVIEVIKVSKSVAACDIKEEKSPIKVGDAVR